ncbi:MAG: hypothetical protein HY951_08545 [Bacteroidia bacterium]|nr:hypothetical protein [Bacteroidia bacterium]
MKKLNIVLLLIFVMSISFSQAQTAGKMSDKGRLALAVWVPDQIENMPVIAKKNLENKLMQIVTANGMGGDAMNSRFIITANVMVTTKDITATAPPMQAYTLDVTLYIGDGFEGKSFSSYTTTCKGVGENETKAYNAALKAIKTSDPNYQSFIEKGKTKIIEYYNAQCDIIIKEAKTLAGQNKFDEAIWKLTAVPDVCTECWNKCMAVVPAIFQQKIDFECKTKLLEANNLWNAGQSWDAAQSAGAILATIDPKSACFNESKALSDKIAKRIKEVDKREWDFKYDKEIGLERDMIKAYRDVGVAYGNGQPQNVTYKSFW